METLKLVTKHGTAMRKFVCKECGCKFHASRDELQVSHSEDTITWCGILEHDTITWKWISFSTTCPECDSLCKITLEGQEVLDDYNRRTRKSEHLA